MYPKLKPLINGSFDIVLVTNFMSDFNKSLDQYEVHFKVHLQEYLTTLGKQYEALVPQEVPYTTSIQRYCFCCCDLQWIQVDLEQMNEKRQQ
jgi:hypothetical protein